MSANMDKVVKLYKELSVIPNLGSARLVRNGAVVESVWTQRNIEKGKTTKFLRTLVLQPDFTEIVETIPVDISSELASATSPSEKWRAVVREADDKQYLEIWRNQNLYRTVDLIGLDLHGKIYTDVEFFTLQWSPDETSVMYVAELKRDKSEPFYKRSYKLEKELKEISKKGEEYLFRQDWGEQLVGKQRSVIGIYNIEADSVQVLEGVPENICPAQVIYTPNGEAVVGIAYDTNPRKLGLIYCSNRLSTIFSLDFKGNYEQIPLVNQSVKAPIFTPDGKTLLWLQRGFGGPHNATMTLMKTTFPLHLKENNTSMVLGIVKTVIKTDNGENFHGLYNTSFVRRCFASGNRLILSTPQKTTINSYIIDIDTGKLSELSYSDGSQIVLDVSNDIILANRRNFFRQDQLVIAKLPEKGSEAPINWLELTTSETIPLLEGNRYEYLDLNQKTNESVTNSSAIYLGPETGTAGSRGLIVWPHGGPHSAYANNLSLECAIFLSCGYSVLQVNYRGSIGAGQDSIDFLPGKIGIADVADCILAADTALEKYPLLDANNLVLVGGSHGGFLVTHLSGQFPDKFKAVVTRNPVIDVASMSIISDIPDWCAVEAGKEYSQVGKVDDELLMAMRKASPIEYAHLVKAPTLLQLGSKDLRVPAAQGMEWYYRLKANGVNVRVNLYEDNHPLGGVLNEMDNIINSVLWIQAASD